MPFWQPSPQWQVSNSVGMVQAWVAHFVTPLKCTYTDESRVRNRTKSTDDMTNNITMVLEPLTPPVAWI
jgi:hypothetical protein